MLTILGDCRVGGCWRGGKMKLDLDIERVEWEILATKDAKGVTLTRPQRYFKDGQPLETENTYRWLYQCTTHGRSLRMNSDAVTMYQSPANATPSILRLRLELASSSSMPTSMCILGRLLFSPSNSTQALQTS